MTIHMFTVFLLELIVAYSYTDYMFHCSVVNLIVFADLNLHQFFFCFFLFMVSELCRGLPEMILTLFFFPVSKFAPKKWGVSEGSSPFLIGILAGISFLISQGIDLRPNLAAILGLAFIDSIFLGGCCLAQISSYWPPNRRRILIHEAGHLLTGKL